MTSPFLGTTEDTDMTETQKRAHVSNWMRDEACNFDNPTALAENAADAYMLYEDDVEFVIPEWVFELALEHKPVD